MIIPYLVFSGKCSEAIEFYENAFNCKAERCQVYGDYIPEGISSNPDNLDEWILHAEMEISGTRIWFADEIQVPVTEGNSIKLSITFPTKEEANGVFEKLSVGADIVLPPTDTFYSTFHAGLVDRYGKCWNIVAEEAPGAE